MLRYPRLQKHHGLSDEDIDAFVQAIQLASFVITLDLNLIPSIVVADAKDDPIVATAVQTKSSVICTLDNHLYNREVLKYCAERDISVLSDVELLLRLNQT